MLSITDVASLPEDASDAGTLFDERTSRLRLFALVKKERLHTWSRTLDSNTDIAGAPERTWVDAQRLVLTDEAGEAVQVHGVLALGPFLIAHDEKTIAVSTEMRIQPASLGPALTNAFVPDAQLFAECDGRFTQLESTAVAGGIASVRASTDLQILHLVTREGPQLLSVSDAGLETNPSSMPDTAAHATSSAFADQPIVLREDSTTGLSLGTLGSEHAAYRQPTASDDRAAVIPLSLDRLLTVQPDGSCSVQTFLDYLSRQPAPAPCSPAEQFSLLQLVVHSRTQAKYLFGGLVSGDLLVWDCQSLRCVFSGAIADAAITRFVPIIPDGKSKASRLVDCVLCISADGLATIVQLDNVRVRNTLPGRDAALDAVAVRGDEIMLVYEDDTARVWDMRTQELRHAVDATRASALLDDKVNPWSLYDATLQASARVATGILAHHARPPSSSAVALQADFRKAIEAAARALAPKGEAAAQAKGSLRSQKSMASLEPYKASSAAAQKALGILRPFLLLFWPAGVPGGQALPLDAQPPAVSCGLSANTHLSASVGPVEAPKAYTLQQLILRAMLLVLSRISDCSDDAMRAIAKSTKQLRVPAVELETLTEYFFDSCSELARAARYLFDETVVRFDDKAYAALAEAHAPGPFEELSPAKVVLLGTVASRCMQVMNPALLKSISSSVEHFLNDTAQPVRQAIALELCHLGFDIWQNYVDAMELARTLFALATAPDAPSDLTSRARQATLQIANANTPLFMTTLSHDILHARSPAHANATMRLVAFMVRRQPTLLFPNLPRLAEAVVKSLDPTSSAFREAVVQGATVMISELVNTYPSIAFHGRLQRLAVGTHEGAVIMYDLKTATRLFVIEGHRRPVSACSFSPDGRRLVTVSLGESKALVWKVGSSLASVFAPGSLPRQGGTDPSGAYKAIEFHVAGECAPEMALRHQPVCSSVFASSDPPREGELFTAIRCEWSGDHNSARIQIGEATMSFDAV